MNENRGPWYLLTGIIIGIGLGLLVSWVFWPTRYRDNAPASLSEDYKDSYRALIAAAYMSSGDLERARSRLINLEDVDMSAALITQARRSMVEGHPDAEVRALGALGLELDSGEGPATNITLLPSPTSFAVPTDLPTPTPTQTGVPSPVVAWTPTVVPTTDAIKLPQATSIPTQSGTPTPPTSTFTPLPTFTIAPTLTPTPTLTPGQPFRMVQKEIVCNPNLAQPLIQVQVRNASGDPVPGVEGFIFWDGGNDRFITGLKPEMGLGYADFIMNQTLTYTVQLVNGEPVRDLSVNQCTNASNDQYLGGWLLVFEQP